MTEILAFSTCQDIFWNLQNFDEVVTRNVLTTKVRCDRTSKSFWKAMDVWCSYTTTEGLAGWAAEVVLASLVLVWLVIVVGMWLLTLFRDYAENAISSELRK